MPSGLQIWDRGDVVLDTNTRVGMFWDTFSTGGNKTGSITVSALIGREVIFVPVKSTPGLSNSGGLILNFNSSTGEISWDTNYSSNASYTEDTYTVVYGAM